MAEGGQGAATTPIVAAATPRPRNNLPGILYMLAGTISFVLNDSIVKVLGTALPPGEIMALRGTFASALMLIAAYWLGALTLPAAGLVKPAFVARLLAELGSTVTFVISLMHMRFADASGIQQFQPLAVTAASALFLREPVGWRRWMAAVAGLIGVLLIVKPGTGAFEPYALLSGCCVLFVALRDLSTRAVMPGFTALALSLFSALIVTAAGYVMWSGETWIMPDLFHWILLGTAATLIIGGYLGVTQSVRTADLSVVSPFRYSSVIFAVLLQITIWGVMPDNLALLGMAIVVLAGLYTLHREQVRYVNRG